VATIVASGYLMTKGIGGSNRDQAFYSKLLKKIERDKNKNKKKTSRGQVDMEFIRRVWQLIKIGVPSLKSKEFLYMLALTGLLILRTYMSIWLADVNGRIVKSIVSRKVMDFLKRILTLALFSIPSSTVNSLLEYVTKSIGMAVRDRMTTYFHKRYLDKMQYYKMTNLDDRISNPD